MVSGGEGEGAAGPDWWALDYIGVNYVWNILEAFDDDKSGFITVNKANNFTRSRPLDWRWVFEKSDLFQPIKIHHSLLHWLAYWAIGDYHCLIATVTSD